VEDGQKKRRFDLTWKMISELNPSKFITKKIDFKNAKDAYYIIDKEPGRVVQIILNYE